MFDAPIVQVAVGLIVVFFVFSTLCSGLAELVNRALRLRAEFLLLGIRNLLNGSGTLQVDSLKKAAGEAENLICQPGQLADLLLKLPIVGTMGQQQDGNPVAKASMPSYLPARTFAAGLMDILVPNPAGATKIDEVIPQIERLPEPARSSILALAKGANQDVARFRLNIERWYDDQMDRVGGWYKRHVRVFIIVFAAIFAVAFNVNVVTLAQSLYTNPDARNALVVQGDALQSCPADQRDACSQAAVDTVVKLGKSSLPLFWQPTNIACLERSRDAQAGNECGFLEARNMNGLWGIVLAVVGWLIATGAFAMGGPFWFDVLGKLASLRGAGAKPPKAPDGSSDPST